MGQIGVSGQSAFSREGKTAPETDVFFRGKEFHREGRSCSHIAGGGIRTVVRDDGSDGAESLTLQGIQQPREEVGTKTGGHQGDDFWGGGHGLMMKGFAGR